MIKECLFILFPALMAAAMTATIACHPHCQALRRFLEPRRSLYPNIVFMLTATLRYLTSNILAVTILRLVLYIISDASNSTFEDVVQCQLIWTLITIIITLFAPATSTSAKLCDRAKETTDRHVTRVGKFRPRAQQPPPRRNPKPCRRRAAQNTAGAKHSADEQKSLYAMMDKPPMLPRKCTAEVSIDVVVRRYISTSSLLIPDFDNGEMHQIIVNHTGHPDILKRFNANFAEFLLLHGTHLRDAADIYTDDEELQQEADNWPYTIQLLRACGIIARQTTDEDPMNVGFVRWRVVFYCDGSLRGLTDTLYLIDMFLTYRFNSPDFREYPQPAVHFYNTTPHSLMEFVTTSTYRCYTLHLNVPPNLHVFSVVPPVFGNRIVEMVFRPSSENTASVLWNGDTVRFNKLFDEQNIVGYHFSSEGEDHTDNRQEFWRFLVNVTFPNQENRLNIILCESVFQNIAMQIHLEDGASAQSPIRKYFEQLLLLPHYKQRYTIVPAG